MESWLPMFGNRTVVVLVFTFVAHLFLHWWRLVSFLLFVVEGWRGGRLERWKVGEVEGWRGGRLERWKVGEVEGGREQIGELFSFVLSALCFVANVSCLDLSPIFLSSVLVFGAFGCHLFLLRCFLWCFGFRCDLSMSFGLFGLATESWLPMFGNGTTWLLGVGQRRASWFILCFSVHFCCPFVPTLVGVVGFLTCVAGRLERASWGIVLFCF